MFEKKQSPPRVRRRRGWEPLEFELPRVVDSARDRWRRWIDTALDSAQDIVESDEEAPTIGGYTYRTEPRSVVVLFAPLDAKDVR